MSTWKSLTEIFDAFENRKKDVAFLVKPEEIRDLQSLTNYTINLTLTLCSGVKTSVNFT